MICRFSLRAEMAKRFDFAVQRDLLNPAFESYRLQSTVDYATFELPQPALGFNSTAGSYQKIRQRAFHNHLYMCHCLDQALLYVTEDGDLYLAQYVLLSL